MLRPLIGALLCAGGSFTAEAPVDSAKAADWVAGLIGPVGAKPDARVVQTLQIRLSGCL
jgi:hypothetical protein